MSARGLIVAAPSSGSGKTLVTLGLVKALRRSGYKLAAFKTGPDYIDPGFLAAASGGLCFNLDPWAMRARTVDDLIAAAARAVDLIIIEGVMGLFDGPPGGGGSTADLAARLGLPVVLVIDAGRQAQSAGAVARGFAKYRDDVSFAGVICNRVASQRHETLLAEGLALADTDLLGMLPPAQGLVLQSRHLGLVQAGERSGLEGLIDDAADWIFRSVDLDAVVSLAKPLPNAPASAAGRALPPPGQRIAIASDVAFAFAYPHLLAGWRAAGAEVLPFSPLAGEAPSASADVIYLPGGYPELHGAVIAANHGFLTALVSASGAGVPVYGECGGYMVLGDGLIDGGGVRHQMAGLLRLETSFSRRGLSLGYRQATLISSSPLGRAGTGLRGHEFHYATTLKAEGKPFANLTDAAGNDLGGAGLCAGQVSGSFFHAVDYV